jgi:hypothetical protein
MRPARLIAMSITVGAVLGLAPAWSDEPSAATPPKATAPHKKPDSSKTAANAANKERPDCFKSTGSRIPPRPGECLSEPGHSWSHDDFDSTGKATAGGGLRTLDPSLH